jgi:hypothetical protein
VVAEEKGYFRDVGLDYEFRGVWEGQDLDKAHALANRSPSASCRRSTRRGGPGERILFEPYTKEIF